MIVKAKKVKRLKPWLTVAEAAELFPDHTAGALYDWIDKGHLSAIDENEGTGKKARYKISRETVERALQQLADGLSVRA